MARKKKHRSKAWIKAVKEGADPLAPFGMTLGNNIRRNPLKGRRGGGHKGPSGNSSTGKVINVKVDQSTWRTKLQASRIKFDDPQKLIYLEELAEHGMKGRSAKAAGVSAQTVGDHLENDPDFAVAYQEAIDAYRDKFVDHAMGLALEGEVHKQFDKDGNCVSEKRVFPIRLIELEMKRVEPGYREKQTIDLNAKGGGVLIAPADMTPEEWIEQQREANNNKKTPDSEESK